jgi:hypothetical protein
MQCLLTPTQLRIGAQAIVAFVDTLNERLGHRVDVVHDEVTALVEAAVEQHIEPDALRGNGNGDCQQDQQNREFHPFHDDAPSPDRGLRTSEV